MLDRLLIIGCLSLGFVACDSKAKDDKKEDSSDDDDAKTKKKKKDKTEASSAPSAASLAPTSTVAAATAAATANADASPTTSGEAPKPIVLPPGRSPVPTVAEWDAETREVTVKGSSALGCETKMVREYLRVTCRGKNDTGGTPLSVVAQKGAREAYYYSAGGVVGIVIPYLQGIDATLAFAWTDKSHPLHLTWPRGAPKPQSLGVFEGARSPLDGTGAAAEICKKCVEPLAYLNMGAATCDFITGNPDCVATYGANCGKLRECAFGEPSAMVSCPAGKSAIMGRSCAPICGPGKTCAAGLTCVEGIADHPVCTTE